MIKPENATPHGTALPIAAKKAWNNGPELVLIGSDHIGTGKTHPQVHEGTGAPFVHSGKSYVTNNASYSFTGTINQAVS